MMNQGENPSPAEKAKQDALYENREPKKILRIITVMAYMTSVSFVGIVLSAYYIFLWHPPNPRLMHAQATSAHHQARVDFLVVDDVTGTPPPAQELNRMVKSSDDRIDLLAAAVVDNQDSGSLKTRREIVKNVNAILRANFEKTRIIQASSEESTESPSSAATFNDTSDYSTSYPPSNNSSFSDFSDNNSTSSSEQTTSSDVPSTEDGPDTNSSRETGAMPTALTPTSTTRKTRSLGKKQHQTPFALKHLEVPIKSEGARRKSLRFANPTTRSVPSDESGAPVGAAGAGAGGGGGSTLGSRLRRFSMQLPRKMSAHNVMASISRTLGTRYSESKAANEIKFAGEESKDKLYEPKHKQKLVRVLTVVAYIISVSLAAIVLSLYYMYIWDPSDNSNKNNTTETIAAASKISCAPQEPIAMPVRNASAALLDKTQSSEMDNQRMPPTPDSEIHMKDFIMALSSPPKQRRTLGKPEFPPQPLPSISSDQYQAEPLIPEEVVTTELYSDDVLED